jgi:hypothetical protein
MIRNANDESTPRSASSPDTPPAPAEAAAGGFLPGRPIEVAAAGSGTTNDPSGTDTRPPDGAPPPRA